MHLSTMNVQFRNMEAYKMLWDVVGTRQNVLINVHSPDEAEGLFFITKSRQKMWRERTGWFFFVNGGGSPVL